MTNLDLTSVFLIALGLSIDCFAVAVSSSVSLGYPSAIQVFRTSLTFGLFQAFMPVVGWLLGQTVVDLVSEYDHWVAFVLLAAIGGRMIWNSLRSSESSNDNLDITRGLSLIILSIATSIDALAVGLSFALLNINIALVSLIIGMIAFIVTVFGFRIGRKVGKHTGERAEVIGGLVLIAIGLRILIGHIV